MEAIFKTAAILAVRKMCDGPITKNVSRGALYVCAKFHACIVEGTILT